MAFKIILWLLVLLFNALINNTKAQPSSSSPSLLVTFPATENQSVIPDPVMSLSSISSIIPSTSNNIIGANIPGSGGVKRNDWWPPSEQEVTQTSPYPAAAIATEIHQPIPSSYYLPASSPPAVLSHYRSEPWSSHYGYPEYVYPVTPPNANNQVQSLAPKYMAIGVFIGLLTLFAIIQGSMITTKRKDIGPGEMLGSRRKRDLFELSDIDHMTPEQQDIFNNDSKVRCIQRTICQENRILFKDFGISGIKLAKYLTRGVKKSLKNIAGWDRLVEDAGAAGRRGEDCNVLYRDCILPVVSKFHE